MTITLEILGLYFGLAAGLVAFFLRIEQRLTRIETRVCALPCLTGDCKKP